MLRTISDQIQAIKGKLLKTHSDLTHFKEVDSLQIEKIIKRLMSGSLKSAEADLAELEALMRKTSAIFHLAELEALMRKTSAIFRDYHLVAHAFTKELAELKGLPKSHSITEQLNLTCAIHNRVLELDLETRATFVILDGDVCEARNKAQQIEIKPSYRRI